MMILRFARITTIVSITLKSI